MNHDYIKPYDLVRLWEDNRNLDHFVVGSDERSFKVENGAIALIIRISHDSEHDLAYVLINNKIGWAYLEECEIIE